MTATCTTYYRHTDLNATSGAVTHRYYVRDYLGSVRAVFDLYGNLEQTNDYNVTGIPSSRHLGNADVHKHTGKEFQGFNGLAWYDNNARYYDPILARFTTQDPLAEKYPWLSPYVHCSNNPLNRVDPTGLFDISEIEEDQCYPLVIVIPSNHKKIDKSRNSLAFEKTISAAKSNNIPIIKVDNLDDYSLSMSAISALNSSVKTYALTSHGKSGMFSIGDTKITPNSDVSSLKEGLEGKSVFLYSCSTAKGPDGSQLIKNFSSQTSSTTVGAMHNLNGGYNFDGSYGLTQSKTPYIDMILGINNQNSYKMSIEGRDASVIYNLTISANGKLNWTSRNIFGGYYLHKLINFFVK